MVQPGTPHRRPRLYTIPLRRAQRLRAPWEEAERTHSTLYVTVRTSRSSCRNMQFTAAPDEAAGAPATDARRRAKPSHGERGVGGWRSTVCDVAALLHVNEAWELRRSVRQDRLLPVWRHGAEHKLAWDRSLKIRKHKMAVLRENHAGRPKKGRTAARTIRPRMACNFAPPGVFSVSMILRGSNPNPKRQSCGDARENTVSPQAARRAGLHWHDGACTPPIYRSSVGPSIQIRNARPPTRPRS